MYIMYLFLSVRMLVKHAVTGWAASLPRESSKVYVGVNVHYPRWLVGGASESRKIEIARRAGSEEDLIRPSDP